VSYDISLYLKVDTGGPEPITIWPADIGNYTANVSRMWTEALGYPLSDLTDKTAGDCRADLERAVTDMTANPAKYQAMNPSNGWGNYDGALTYLDRLREACLAHPNALIHISH
jgi:hypothetical protein